MKFNEGQWRLLPGTEATYPTTNVEVQVEPDALVITGYDHEIYHRAHYLGGTIITARITSPMPDVIRVQLTHFKGRRENCPPLTSTTPAPIRTLLPGRTKHRLG